MENLHLNLPFLVTIGAIGAALTAGWSHLQSLFGWIKGLALITIKLEDTAMENAVRLYCLKTLKESTLGSRAFTSGFHMVYSIHRMQLVGKEKLAPQGSIFWKGWKPLLMSRVNHKEGYSMGNNITFLRGMWNVDQFVEEAIQFYNDTIGSKVIAFQRHKIVYIFGKNKQKIEVEKLDPNESGSAPYYIAQEDRGEYFLNNKIIKWKIEDLVPPRHETSLTDLALSLEANAAVQTVRQWSQSQDWFRQHRVPWRMGILLYGDPGTGKTALVRALAQDLDFPIYVYDLASLSNEELQQHWNKMLSNAPCIALIEDIDSIFQGRKNITGVRGGLTFDSLLNTLDGVERCDGLLVAITTNKVDTVDPAIGAPMAGNGRSTRPGRIDRVFEMTCPNEMGRLQIASRILEGFPEAIQQAVHAGLEDTGAQFQDRCTEIALRLHWKNPAEEKFEVVENVA